jgi:antitoxin MazE
MVTTVQKWGNSLAVRIPKAFAAQIRLTEDTDVEISVDQDRIVIAPARRVWKLDTLVNGITSSNRHREADWGDKAGGEAW